MRRADLRALITDDTREEYRHQTHSLVSDSDLCDMGYVKRDERWRYCPMCGRLAPLPDMLERDPQMICLPTNCDAWGSGVSDAPA